MEEFVRSAIPPAVEKPVAIVVPHAGYVFSGQICADAFRQASSGDPETVVILGTNHTAPGFNRIAIFAKGGFRTPLGVAPVDEAVAAALLAADRDCTADTGPHAREHSVEVQVPFVQVLFPKARIVPVVIGEPDLQMCSRFGSALARALRGRKALIVASSDLSHYPPYEAAETVDRETLRAIASLDLREIDRRIRAQERSAVRGLDTCACGEAPILAAAAWVYTTGASEPFSWLFFWLTLLGGIAIHISANTFNDYFDWTSGADKVNNEYFMPYSGGSRSLELGLITERRLLIVAWTALVIAGLAGLPILLSRGPLLLVFAAAGAFSAYYYTAPPLRLAARKGLGELVVGMNFGPLMTAGTAFALTGQLTWLDFFIGLPIGLLTTAILWINQFPDMQADAQAGKINLVVVLGKERSRWGYLLIVAAAFLSVLAGVIAGFLPWPVLLVMAALPLAINAVQVLFCRYNERSLIKANSTTILLHLIAGLLLITGLLVSAAFLSPVG